MSSVRFFQKTTGRKVRLASVSLVAGAVVVLAGCSSSGSGDKSSSAGSSASTTGTSKDSVAAAAKAKEAAWIKGTESALPKTGPSAQKGKSVWVISCGQAAAACALWANDAVEAGKAMGWSTQLYDTKLVPANANTGIEDAIAAHASGIVVEGNTCPQTEQGLKAAKAANIPVIGLDEVDCNDSLFGDSGPSLLVPFKYNTTSPTVDEFMKSQGALQADYLLASLGSSANVIEFKSTDIPTKTLINTGFENEYKAVCSQCKLTSVPYTLNDLISGSLKTKTQDALTSDADASGVEVPVDSDMALVIGPVLSGSGKKLMSTATEGLAATIAAARTGKWEDGGAGEPFEWEAWAAIDGLNRAFAGQAQVDSGVGIRLWSVTPTQENLPPAGQNYQPAANFKANYKRIWGVS